MNDLIAADRLLTPTGLVDGGWVKVTGERVEAWGEGHPRL